MTAGRGLHLVQTGGDLAAAGIVLDLGPARTADQLALVLGLEAGQALVVEADLPQHRRRQLAGGVEALGLLDQADTVELEGRHPVGRGVVDLAGQIDEPAVGAELVPHHGFVLVEGGREGPGLGDRVADELRVGPHRPLPDRHGQFDVVAVEDRAPLAGDDDGAETLGLAEAGVFLGRQSLHEREAHDHGREAQGQDDDEKPETTPKVGLGPRRRGRARPSPRPRGGGRTRTGALRAPASVARAPGPGRCGHRVGRAVVAVVAAGFGTLVAVGAAGRRTAVAAPAGDASNLGFLAAEPGGTALTADFGGVFGDGAAAVVGSSGGRGGALSPGVR